MNIRDIAFLLPHGSMRSLFSIVDSHTYRDYQCQRLINESKGYSLKGFDDRKAIFVHVPKAAGISVCQSLFGNLAGGHSTIKRYMVIFSPVDFNLYFKFTFVRNPWDRLFSAFNFLKQGGICNADLFFSHKYLSQYESFNDFVIDWVNKENIQKYTHFIPQYQFLCPPFSSNVSVDFIGFFENLEDDFLFIKDKLNVDVCLEHSNQTQKKEPLNYMDFYTEETRGIVGDVYSKDISLLGYNFDSSSLSDQISLRKSKVL